MAVLLLWGCWRAASTRLFWSDEILSYILLLRSSSIGHMLRAISAGIDGSPPLYFLLMRPWTMLAGGSELALRLPSAIFISMAFALIWWVLRRRCGFWVVLAGTAGCYLWGEIIFRYAIEARNYGFFLMMTAATVYQFDRVTSEDKPSRRQLMIHALLHGGLVLTHLFGFLYSGCLLLAVLVSDLRAKRRRVPVYLSIAGGWMMFLPWLPFFLHQATLARVGFWLPKPEPAVLIHWFPYSYTLPVLKILGLTLLVSLLSGIGGAQTNAADDKATRPRLFDALGLAGLFFVFLVPVLAWIISVFFQSVWIDRYMFPGIIGWMVFLPLLGGFITDRCRRFITPNVKVARILWMGGCVAGLATVALGTQDFIRQIPPASETRPATGNLPGNAPPIATESSHDFLYWWLYQPQCHCYYILDWESAASSTVLGYAFDYKSMEALHRSFPELPIIRSDDFLVAHDRFFYFNPEGNRAWLDAKLARNPEYMIEDVPPLQRVTRRRR